MTVGLTSIAAPRTPVIPAIATAAGFSTVKFFEDFMNANGIDAANSKVAGFNLYTGTFPFEGTVLTPTPVSDYSVSNSLLTITTNRNPNLSGYEFGSRTYLGASAPRTVGGPIISPGGYFEIRAAFDSTVTGTTGWPGWYMLDQAGTLALADNNPASVGTFGEVDMFEMMDGTTLTNNVIQWNADGAFGTVNSPHVSNSGVTPDSNFHTYGLVWKTVAQGGGTGSFQFYYDGVLKSGSTLTYASSDAFFICDSGNFIQFLGTGPNQTLQVDYLLVCQ